MGNEQYEFGGGGGSVGSARGCCCCVGLNQDICV